MSLTRSNSYGKLCAAQRKAVEQFPNILENVGAFEKAVGNKPIFTRDVLQQAADNRAKAHNRETQEDDIVVPHVLGDGSRKIWGTNLPRFMSGFSSPCISWNTSYRLQEVSGKAPLYNFGDAPDDGFPTRYILGPVDHEANPLRLRVAEMSPPVAQVEQMLEWQHRIMSHHIWHTMEKVLRNMTAKVDNMVVLALGPPIAADIPGSLEPRTCAQHILAICMAEFLANLYGDGKVIPIVVFDPQYTVADMKLLSCLSYPITIVSDPYQYLAITPSTLVMCVGAPTMISIFEIIADSLFPSGPAALFSNELFKWHEQGQNAALEFRVPRVSNMLDLYHEPLWLGGGVPSKGDELLSWLFNQVFYSRKA